MSEAAIDNTPEAPTEMRLLELGANLLGIEPVRLGLSQGSFARKEVPEAPWFRPL